MNKRWADFTLELVKALTEAKYQGDLAAFEVAIEGREECKEALEYFSRASDYENDDDGEGGRAHLIGLFRDKKGDVLGFIHQQPKHHISEHPMTGFQASLVFGALKGES